MKIREFDQAAHLEDLRECIIALQDYERDLDRRMPAGSEIVDAYIVEMLDRCQKYHGKIFVAESEGEIAGYVSVLTKVRSDELEDGDMEYGLIADLVVKQEFRSRGTGRQLLQVAERFAVDSRVQWLRVGVLAANRPARALYASLGFSEYQLQYEKELTRGEQSG